ncbi:hypothetical protein FJT64_025186 [Amphibalanus amphitrite]|uniref:Uncharacterized protein n=1 Tax=Amphibalanus amphitrite TaxID=1232801 RepID=A0A6A4WGH1_AMPAM|nr:hypothetical protein FJT64_025186 [Amphibalanus amphitrite]
MFNQQWRDFLVAQQLINDNYQTRNRQESRALLPATAQVPADIQDFQFLPDRLKIFVTVGRGGWAAALTALPDLELQQLGVQLLPPAPVLHLPPAPAPSVQYAGSSLISAESQQTIDEIESLPYLHQLLTPSPRPLPLSPSCLPELPDLDSILGRSSSANWPEASTEPSETDSDDEYQGSGNAKDRAHCDLCGGSASAVRCDRCSGQVFCLSCDDMYHRHPKRSAHVRKAVDSIQRPFRPPLPPKSDLQPPVPPPRRNKRFGLFGKKEQSPALPRKESASGVMGSLKRFMGVRPLPPPPTQKGMYRRVAGISDRWLLLRSLPLWSALLSRDASNSVKDVTAV